MKLANVQSLLFDLSIGIVLLFILHFESASFGIITISHLWKGVLLAFLVAAIFNKSRVHVFIYKPLLVLAMLQLCNADILFDSIGAIVSFSTILLMALIGIYSLNFSTQKIEKLLILSSSLFILSFIPYKLGILTSLGAAYDLKGYGVEISGLVGPFQKVHSASTTLAGSLLVVTFFWFKGNFNRLYLSFLFLLGFYFLFYTYARTGMAMVAFGVIPIAYFFGRKNVVNFYRLVFAILISSILASTWVLSNDIMVRRILGERDYYQEDSLETLGSGRVSFALTSEKIYLEANLIEKIIGIGVPEILYRMNTKIGLPVFPHNGFLFILLANGLLGFFAFSFFLFRIYKLQKMVKSENRVLLSSLFVAYLCMTTFQSYDMIYMFFLLSLSISYAYKDLQLAQPKRLVH